LIFLIFKEGVKGVFSAIASKTNFDNKFLHFEPILAIIIGYILSSK